MAVLTGKMAEGILKRALRMPNFLVALLKKGKPPERSPIPKYIPKIKHKKIKKWTGKKWADK